MRVPQRHPRILGSVVPRVHHEHHKHKKSNHDTTAPQRSQKVNGRVARAEIFFDFHFVVTLALTFFQQHFIRAETCPLHYLFFGYQLQNPVHVL